MRIGGFAIRSAQMLLIAYIEQSTGVEVAHGDDSSEADHE